MKIDLYKILPKELLGWLEAHPKKQMLLESIQEQIFDSIVNFRECQEKNYNGFDDWIAFALKKEEEWKNSYEDI
ncbi:hypothetical protein [Pseudalkalibacillus caeni]|uniref:Uncharacterized protein n=1 Tax=Exobacillus caeni TaxID=2574798 RepID=A0A5R9F8D9_9BACL|nr:hypothetical protein [Pseudalkalibacillus caeni]TLS37898.1 hypothetical protein FCL54_08755 [Pseudalkalibacillus caeni]